MAVEILNAKLPTAGKRRQNVELFERDDDSRMPDGGEQQLAGIRPAQIASIGAIVAAIVADDDDDDEDRDLNDIANRQNANRIARPTSN